MPLIHPHGFLGHRGGSAAEVMKGIKLDGDVSLFNASGISGTNSDQITCSFWIRFLPGFSNDYTPIFYSEDSAGEPVIFLEHSVNVPGGAPSPVFLLIAGDWSAVGADDFGIVMLSGTGWDASDGWMHVLMAADRSEGYFEMWINGTDALDAGFSFDNVGIDWTTVGGFTVMGDNLDPAADQPHFEIADFWMDDIRLLIDNGTVRGDFYDSGLPVFLGEDGELPTGSPPIIYHTAREEDFLTNLGTGYSSMTKLGSASYEYVSSGLEYVFPD